jgi:hypothetical protein
MNTVELDGKKVPVRPSQAKSTKGKEVIIGEERRPRMIRPKNPKMANGRRSREESHDLVQKSPSTSSWLNTEMARPVLGVAKTGPSGSQTGLSVFPNRTIWFPWIRPVLLRQQVRLATNPGHRHDKIQKFRILINRSIIWRLTTRSGHQYLGHGGLHH